MPGQRVGLVGANGCGKSTLLRCLSGQRKIDNGRLVVGRSVEMGYLEQTAVSGSDRTVWEEARSRMTELIEAEAAIDAASQAASTGLLSYVAVSVARHADLVRVHPATARLARSIHGASCTPQQLALHMLWMHYSHLYVWGHVELYAATSASRTCQHISKICNLTGID